MKQTQKTIYAVSLATLLTACSMTTPTPNNMQMVTPVFTASETKAPIPVSPSDTPTISTPTLIPTATAHYISFENQMIRGIPRYSPDGDSLVLLTDSGVIAVDATTYQSGRLLVSFEETYHQVTISPDAKLVTWDDQLLSLNDDNVLPDLQLRRKLGGYSIFPSESRFSPDNTVLAVFYGDTQTDIWDLVDGKLLFTIPEVLSIDFSPDGNLIAAVTIVDNIWRIQLHEVRTGILLKAWPGQRAVFFSDNRLALENNETIRIYDLSTGKVPNFFNGRFPAFSPDGTLVALLYNDQVEIHRLSDGKLLYRLPGNFMNVTRFGIRFAPDGQSLAGYAYWSICCGGYTERLSLWRTADSSLIREAPSIRNFDFSPDGKSLAVASGGLQIWSTTDGSVLFDLKAIMIR